MKPGPSGAADAGASFDLRGRGGSPHPSPPREAVDSGGIPLKPGMRYPSGAMDTGSSSDLSGGDDSSYPSPPGLEGVDSKVSLPKVPIAQLCRLGCAVHQVKVLILKLLVTVPQVWCTAFPQKSRDASER